MHTYACKKKLWPLQATSNSKMKSRNWKLIEMKTYFRSQNKGLHKLPLWLSTIRQQTHDLDHYSITQGCMSIHMTNFSVTFAEVQR